MAQTKKTLYGSGKIYSVTFDEAEFPKVKDFNNLTAEESAAIMQYITKNCIEDNRIGLLKGGFQVTLSTNSLSDKDDLGELKVDVINEENCVANFNLFNVNGETVAKQYPTATYSKTEDGSSLAAIGGLEHIDETSHVIIFDRIDKVNGNTYVICTGKNVSGLTVGYTPDSVTPLTVSVNCEPLNESGNLVWIYEPAASGAAKAKAINQTAGTSEV